MKLLTLLALILFVVAFVCFAVPTAVFDATGMEWLTGGFIALTLDELLGGWTFHRVP